MAEGLNDCILYANGEPRYPKHESGSTDMSHGALEGVAFSSSAGRHLAAPQSLQSQQTRAAAHTCYVYPFADHGKLGTGGVKVSGLLCY